MPNTPVDEEKLASAFRWLDKAIAMEAEGKSPGLVGKAMERACMLEKEALGIKA